MINASIMVMSVAQGKAKTAGCMPRSERRRGHGPGQLALDASSRETAGGGEKRQSPHGPFPEAHASQLVNPAGPAAISRKPRWCAHVL